MWWIVAEAFAATSIDRSLDAPGEPAVSVSAPCGTIEIAGTDRPTVHVRGTVGDNQAFETSSVAGRVTVRSSKRWLRRVVLQRETRQQSFDPECLDRRTCVLPLIALRLALPRSVPTCCRRVAPASGF